MVPVEMRPARPMMRRRLFEPYRLKPTHSITGRCFRIGSYVGSFAFSKKSHHGMCFVLGHTPNSCLFLSHGLSRCYRSSCLEGVVVFGSSGR